MTNSDAAKGKGRKSGPHEAVDALAAKTLPGLERSVKWGMAYYGVGGRKK